MASDSSVIEVYSQGELLLPFSSVPTFEEMLLRLEDHLSCSRAEFALFFTDKSGNEHQLSSEERFQRDLSEADLPFIVRLEGVEEGPGGFFCPYCDAALTGMEGQCQKCKTVNWDAWVIGKRGEEQYCAMQETKGREMKGFSFGPVDFIQEPKPIFQEEKQSSGGKYQPGFVEEDEDLNQRGSMDEPHRVSFGEDTEGKFETPPRKPSLHSDSNPRFQMSDGLVDFETPPRDSQPRDSQPQSESHPQMATPPAKVPEAIISDSPEIEKGGGVKTVKAYRGGLQASPYLNPGKSGLHDRATCSICQRTQRSSSILTRQSDYKDSLFRYSRVTGESSTYTRDSYNARLSSPSRYLSEQSVFTSNSFAHRSYYSPLRGEGGEWESGKNSYTKPLRNSGGRGMGSAGELLQVWQCRRCGATPPWYFTHCQNCELVTSLGMQPLDAYKRRVELMCRR